MEENKTIYDLDIDDKVISRFELIKEYLDKLRENKIIDLGDMLAPYRPIIVDILKLWNDIPQDIREKIDYQRGLGKLVSTIERLFYESIKTGES